LRDASIQKTVLGGPSQKTDEFTTVTKLIFINQKAKELGLTVELLRQCRSARLGPVHVEYGDTVRHWPEDKPAVRMGARC
jgi:hypothetical protein